MMDRKYYLIKLIEDSVEYWLRSDCNGFHRFNDGKDKEYTSLKAATIRANRILTTLRRHNNHESTVHVVEVTYELCNPELPDGYYRPVYKVVV